MLAHVGSKLTPGWPERAQVDGKMAESQSQIPKSQISDLKSQSSNPQSQIPDHIFLFENQFQNKLGAISRTNGRG